MTSRSAERRHGEADQLAEIESAVLRVLGSRRSGREAVGLARARGMRARTAGADDSAIALAFSTELATHLAIAHTDPELVRKAIRQVELATATALAWSVLSAAVRDTRWVELRSGAVGSVLTILEALSPVGRVSLWAVDVPGTPNLVSGAGGRGAGELAGRVIASQSEQRTRGMCCVPLPKERALVARCAPSRHREASAALRECASAIGSLLDATEREAETDASRLVVVQAAERRLARIGFDLHDGPLQDLALLRGQIRLLRRHLESVLPAEHREILVGHTHDLEANVGALDRSLRQFAGSFESPAMLDRPLAEVLESERRRVAEASGLEIVLRTSGDLDAMSPSRRVAVFRIVQEALSNAMKHSGASRVEIEIVSSLEDGTFLAVRDDGRGFDVSRTLAVARRHGRLGLAGVGERVRMLDGHTRISSQTGGPTELTVILPAWPQSRSS